ncbi:unnamed protein product [Spirodela intermedia]|uniref:LysM domain-containing protein n=1 Tax=Spirodela intermedia TaxID=51605 RepID=A0A7I8IED9_SPIIN|nr:unnamed protein product [Spirodela intermedia]CAA6655754.1 unnamed protein product [Spirodela intermedia]
MDTLAGVAIKYGVEVADIKRMNSLVTDLQMFALKSLKIPVSLAMSSLLGYYGLSSPENDPKGEGTEMAVYGAQISEPSYNSHQRSRSLVNGFLLENGHSVQGAAIVEATENCETDRSGSEKPVRRRQKIDVESPELSLKEDSDGAFSGKTEKSLAPRPKSINRLDFDSGFLAASPMGDSILANGVKKSSSTSNLLESEGSSSMWLTSKWAMKPDATSKPLFDGLPRPITFRRNKAAMD